VTPPAPTRVACLTPPGQAALAVLGVHGPRAWEAVRAVFRPRSGELPAEPIARRFWLGRMGGEVADEVVVAVKRTVPVPWVEVHGHGGREVVRFLLDLLVGQGLELCSWQEFLSLTMADRLSALAAVALAEAPTTRTAAILLDQQAGALGHALDAACAALDGGDANEARRILGELLRYAALGRHLTQPWRVVVAGAPNVGKSSLVNALAGYQRSVVAATPGTTRDVVTTRLAIDGWPVELADTAGLRSGGSSLEEEGIRRARATAAAADLCLWLLDAAAEPVWPGPEVGAVRLVVNKVDLPAAWDLSQAAGAVRVSAATGEGLAGLCQALGRWLVPEAPPPGVPVPFTAALVAGIEEAQRLLAVSQVMAQLPFPDPELFGLLGGEQTMIESPLLQKMIAEGRHKDILALLKARFGTVPRDVTRHLRDVLDDKKIQQLAVLAGTCSDLQAFREGLLS
jgi:tRNA modification GTPase